MANREALRELQSRLATRLQAARTEAAYASWLAVEASGQNYLFPLGQAGEIFPWGKPQPVPYTRSWFLGVANLRGGLHGVVDFGRFVGRTPSTARPEGARSEARLIGLNAALELNCTLLIDRLAGLRKAEDFASSALAPEGSPVYFGTEYIQADGERWQEIDLQALAQQPAFLSIGA